MEKIGVDFVLVPIGLLVLFVYHIWLLRQIIKHPNRTVIGVNAFNRHLWVLAMMEDVPKNGVLAVQTLRNNIMASTLLASTAIMMTSLIALLMTSGGSGRWTKGPYIGNLSGDKSDLGYSIKFFCILVCFLGSFFLNVQSIRYYSHASILINVPYKKMLLHSASSALTTTITNRCRPGYTTTTIEEEYVGRTVNKGSYFWSLGLRVFYFSLPLFFWIFGPIPMLICCLVLVFMLYFLDVVSSDVSSWTHDHDQSQTQAQANLRLPLPPPASVNRIV